MDNYRNFTGRCGIRKNYYNLEDPDLGCYATLQSPDVSLRSSRPNATIHGELESKTLKCATHGITSSRLASSITLP
jgi:hypothetical protein